MAGWVTEQTHCPPKGTHASFQTLSSLQALVDPSPNHPPPGIPQGLQKGKEALHPGPTGRGSRFKSRLLQGDQGRQKQTLVFLLAERHPPELVDGQEVRLRPDPTPLSLPTRSGDPPGNEQGPAG